MRRNEVSLDCDFDVGHVAGHAVAPRAVFCVMRVRAYRTFQSSRILRTVAGETKRIAFRNKVRFVAVAVNVVAIEAANFAMVHRALNEIVPLHAIFVSSEVGKLIEIGCSRLEIFELPIVGQPFSRHKSYRPVVILAVYRILQRTSLRVALHANIIPTNIIE